MLNDSILNIALTQSLSLGNNEINNITSDQSTVKPRFDSIKISQKLNGKYIQHSLKHPFQVYLNISINATEPNEIANNAKSFRKLKIYY